MGKEAAVRAYRDSLYDAAQYDIEMRTGSRTTPLVGGFVPAMKLLGNGIARPFKVAGALMFGGSEDSGREFPKLPPVPETFKDSSLGNAFAESWKLKEEAAKARVEGFAKLLKLDISGYWQKASVASYAEARDTHVVFPEEGRAQDAARASFADSISYDSSSSIGRS